ncbi:MAG: hypothetical protein QGM50_00475 [Anaerolineae bacterium]|nr:hypothetical protein [Anaerolineae bacterium]MDK1117239.1 hypothetical protein [Anaerolineae bacterium]
MKPLPNLITTDRIAFVISIAAVFGVYFVSDRVYERMAHFEDEMAYIWQAQAISGGDLVLPSPPNPKSFMTPFVIDHNGVRFGKYPPGWPIILALGFAFNFEDWINPLLGGLGIWLLYLLAKRITTGPIGLLAIILMLSSPMFWLLSGSALSHTWSIVVALGFVSAWLSIFVHAEDEPQREKKVPRFGFHQIDVPIWVKILVAGLSLGVLVLTRPMNAVGVAIPFFIHGLILLVRGDKATRIKVLTIGLLTGSVGGLFFVWQFALTGDFFLNPYTLWWKYDKLGFGEGYGRWGDGHSWDHAMYIIKYSLWSPRGTRGDVFGWENLWWIFLPFGLWSLRKKLSSWLVTGIFPALLLAYIPYWIGSWQYGPRYYYEGMLSLTILSAAGIIWLAGNGMHIRKVVAGLALAVFMGYNLIIYLPDRLWEMHGMYNINRAMLEPFYTTEAQKLRPALVIVHTQEEWTEYGGLLELQDANLTTPFIFTLNRRDTDIADFYDSFPQRQLLHYYPDDPFKFYQIPRK